MLKKLKKIWGFIRRLSGDDAYERYLLHHAKHHSGEIAKTKAEFFKEWQDSKWTGIKRCC
ncbi:MAG: YbdD/YjiX family protein [Methylophilaceae bacterium]